MIQYGYLDSGEEFWTGWTRAVTRTFCIESGLTMIARDVGPTRVVSIR